MLCYSKHYTTLLYVPQSTYGTNQLSYSMQVYTASLAYLLLSLILYSTQVHIILPYSKSQYIYFPIPIFFILLQPSLLITILLLLYIFYSLVPKPSTYSSYCYPCLLITVILSYSTYIHILLSYSKTQNSIFTCLFSYSSYCQPVVYLLLALILTLLLHYSLTTLFQYNSLTCILTY